MKKYLQYNAAYSNPSSDVKVGHRTPPVPQGQGRNVLDLSGRSDGNVVAMVTGQKWTNEQEAALDLSGYTRQQDEALDLTKPATQKGNNGFSQSGQSSHSNYQSNRPTHTPPSSRHSRSPANQSYSLLQAALNSNQPNAGLVDRNGQSVQALLDSRLFSGVQDVGRGIKPFTSRPMGITVPHMALSTSTGGIIQGSHKPIAITTPQPHNTPVNTKNQSVSDTTVSVTNSSQSIASTSNQGYSVSQSNYRNTYHGHVPSRKLGVAKAMSKQITDQAKGSYNNMMMERYMLQNPEGFPSHLLGGPTMIHPDMLSGFSCSQCPKIFKTKAAMKLHMTVHKTSEERQYGCQVCQRRFLHRHHLVVHQRKHSGEKPFKCDACSKTFMAIFLLHKHLRKHARESGSVCEISIEQLKQLQEQKLINTGPQPLTYSNVPPLLQTGEPVIVLDNEISQSNVKTPKQEINEDVSPEKKRKIGEVIGEVNRDTTHTEVVLPIMGSVARHIVDSERKMVGSSSEKSESAIIPVDLKTDPTIENNSMETNQDSDKTADSKQDITDHKEPEHQEKVSEKDVEKSETLPELKTESEKETVIEEPSVKVEEIVNPFPEYTSDDEVELDFNTGELIVIKNKIHENKKDPETIEDDPEGTDVVSEETGGETATQDEEVNIKSESDESFSKSETNSAENEIEEKNLETEDVNKASDEAISNNISDSVDSKKETNDSIVETSEAASAVKTAEIVSTPINDTKDELMEFQISKPDGTSGEVVYIENQGDVNEGKSVGRDIQTVMNELKDKLCTSEETESVAESASNENKETEGKNQEKSEIPRTNSQTNIFEKMYESVSDMKVNPSDTMKGRKGKKKSRKVKCEICARTFHSNHYLLLHMAVHKRNPMLQSLKKAKANQMKVMGFVNKANVTCEICNKVFKFQKSLNSHKRVHSEKLMERKLYRKAFRDFVSGTKPQSLKKAEKQRQSMGAESQVENSEVKGRLSLESAIIDNSSECEKLDSADNFDDDPPIKIIIGSDNMKRYVCHACDNTYTTKQKLRLHALIHKDNCFLCDICGKSFFRQLTLEKHLSTHRLPRPHICDLCKKSFIHRSSLMRHKAAHLKMVAPNVKQQLADIHFETKMRDTYSMLQEERLQQMQKQIVNPAIIPTGLKYDPLDLTVRIKSEESCLPPVLSPANIPSTSQPNAWNLSPPMITEEPVHNKNIVRRSLDSVRQSLESMQRSLESSAEDTCPEELKDRMELIQSAKLAAKQKRRTESGCSESDVLSSDGNQTGPKKARKTRVYQTSCRVCKEMFPNVMMLKSHMGIHNTVETHLYECHICRHRFTQSCSLLRHLKTSCQENRMKCVPCNKTFHRRNTFEQHMRLHEGGPPSNLDGSFYDKRRDEAEVREERESDIENNNSSKVTEIVIQPLTVENVSLFDQVNSQELKTEELDGDDTDSDARTYLYSEGEVHERHSDLSENEGSPNNNRKGLLIAEDLTKNNMTLNLLSAVCSDIRNAEKEEELKRKELEEKQKELETIEILANLKRGAMQKSMIDLPNVSSKSPLEIVPLVPASLAHGPAILPAHMVQSQLHNEPKLQAKELPKESFPRLNDHKVIGSSPPAPLPLQQPLLLQQPQQTIPNYPVPQPDFHPFQRIPSIIDTNLANLGSPKIPTVVQDAKEDRKSCPPPLEQMASRLYRPPPPLPLQPPLLPHAAFSRDISLLHDLSQLKAHPSHMYPAIHERLSLLMKAQVTAPMPLTTHSFLPEQYSIHNTLSHNTKPSQSLTSNVASSVKSPIPVTIPSRPTATISKYDDTPQDLSVKVSKTEPIVPGPPPAHYIPRSTPSRSRPLTHERSLSTETRSRPEINSKERPEGRLTPRSEFDPRIRPGSAPIPPPLVPVFQCDVCSMVVYNKIDLHLHMVEHFKASGMDVSGKLPESKKKDQPPKSDTPLDFTQTDMKPLDHSTPKQSKISPPSTLDLSVKKSDNQSAYLRDNQSTTTSDLESPGSQHHSISSYKTSEKLSPMTGTDSQFSDIASSPNPMTSGNGNLDLLRQELRLKIFSRRKSQGLEDLKVEFKQPEPTEMSEEERLKLMYRRECNRQAAQRSRMRKKDLVDSLLEELHTEEVIHCDLQRRLKSLVAEKNTLLNVLESHTCARDKSNMPGAEVNDGLCVRTSKSHLNIFAEETIEASSSKISKKTKCGASASRNVTKNSSSDFSQESNAQKRSCVEKIKQEFDCCSFGDTDENIHGQNLHVLKQGTSSEKNVKLDTKYDKESRKLGVRNRGPSCQRACRSDDDNDISCKSDDGNDDGDDDTESDDDDDDYDDNDDDNYINSSKFGSCDNENDLINNRAKQTAIEHVVAVIETVKNLVDRVERHVDHLDKEAAVDTHRV